MRVAELTIDELARTAGLVSTVRLYQNKGLIPPPTKRGRVGYYDERHLERLRAIAQLQQRGFSLAGIKELFDGMESGDSLRSVLGLNDRRRSGRPRLHRRCRSPSSPATSRRSSSLPLSCSGWSSWAWWSSRRTGPG
jgi:DNA-binding transcriptional MerR regulator